jgi:CRISPR/Cas system-associated endonuclease Cas3-HD
MEQTLKEVARNVLVDGMRDRERTYLNHWLTSKGKSVQEGRTGLVGYYADARTSVESVHQELQSQGKLAGLDLTRPPQSLAGKTPEEALPVLRKEADKLSESFFLNPDITNSPKKTGEVKMLLHRHLTNLIEARKEEGAEHPISQLDASTVWTLAARSAAALSIQDVAAAETTLGDHGVRHLVAHNAHQGASLLDSFEKAGGKVKAMDRLIMDDVMVFHDMGYAVRPVRNSIKHNGIQGQDSGHNVIAAAYLRERSQDPNDLIHRVYNHDDLDVIHRCLLHHDKPSSEAAMSDNLTLGDKTKQGRAINMETLVRVADNTHAFEDKLPEIIYGHPKSLRTMRLMKTAGELGDKELVKTLRQGLLEEVESREDLGAQEKKAMMTAARGLNSSSYKFTVGRIAGNAPEVRVSTGGSLEISMEESAVHGKVSEMFGLEQGSQAQKVVKDVRNASPGTPIAFVLSEGQAKNLETTTDFQSQVKSLLLKDSLFTRWAATDLRLSQTSAAVDELLKLQGEVEPGQFAELASAYVSPGSGESPESALTALKASLTEQRRAGMLSFLREPA